MATEKQIASRLVQKHDTEAHWNLATNFIPKQGEIIIYDIDENYNYERFKIGDGKTNVNELPFANDGLATEEALTALQAEMSRKVSRITVVTNVGEKVSTIFNAMSEAGIAGGDSCFVILNGYHTKNLFISFSWKGSERYSIKCVDMDTLTVSRKVIEGLSTTSIDSILPNATSDSPMVSVTYDKLKELRDSYSLTPGTFYRITDYQCTTVQENTGTMANQFDIIVQALNESTLSETASADHHEGDTYFADTNFGAWELKYCFDNDTTRFAWADEENGKGVVYYMKDEFGNECPYDFKNITYKGSEIYGAYEALPDQEAYYPTFITTKGYTYTQWGSTVAITRNSSLDTEKDGVTYYGYTCSAIPPAWSSTDFYITDAELIPSSTMYKIIDGVSSEISYGGTLLVAYSRGNIINSYLSAGAHTLPYIVFTGTSSSNIVHPYCHHITFFGGCNRNEVGEECYNIRFDDAKNTIVPCGTIYAAYDGDALSKDEEESGGGLEAFPMITYETTDTTTLADLLSLLRSIQFGSSVLAYNNAILFKFENQINNLFIGKMNQVTHNAYEVTFKPIEGNAYYYGAKVLETTTLSDIFGTDTYKVDPIADLEARIAALEGKTIPTEDDLKSYIDETILGGEW